MGWQAGQLPRLLARDAEGEGQIPSNAVMALHQGSSLFLPWLIPALINEKSIAIVILKLAR